MTTYESGDFVNAYVGHKRPTLSPFATFLTDTHATPRQRPAIIKEAQDKETGPLFMGRPERWWDNPTWRCENGHVSKQYLKSERLGAGVCLACNSPVWLTFPEDREEAPTMH